MLYTLNDFLRTGDTSTSVTQRYLAQCMFIAELFRCAAEAEPGNILKLYSSSGELVSISPELPANSPETRYILHAVATNFCGKSYPLKNFGTGWRVAEIK